MCWKCSLKKKINLISEQGGLVGLVDYPDDDEDDDEDEDKEDTLPLSKKAKFES